MPASLEVTQQDGGGKLPGWALPVGLGIGAAILFFALRGAQGGGKAPDTTQASLVAGMGSLQQSIMEMRGEAGSWDAQNQARYLMVQNAIGSWGTANAAQQAAFYNMLQQAIGQWGLNITGQATQYRFGHAPNDGGSISPPADAPAGITPPKITDGIGQLTRSRGTPLSGQLVGQSGSLSPRIQAAVLTTHSAATGGHREAWGGLSA